MDLRIVDKYKLKLMPEFFSCSRRQSRSRVNLRSQALRLWSRRMVICKRFLKNNSQHFLNRNGYNVRRLMAKGLLSALGISQVHKRDIIGIRKVRKFLTVSLLHPILQHSYDALVRYFSWWPIDLFNFKDRKRMNTEKRIAYYLWRFPTLSETFIQREVKALRKAGCTIEVVAETADNSDLLDENASSLIKSCTYLKDLQDHLLVNYSKRFLFKNPFLFLNLFLYVVTHKYTKSKSFREDMRIFSKAVLLAGVLMDKKVTHIHSPWANQFAFIALIASRFLGVPYTVQARASDIHRKSSQYALSEKFENADFVITNTKYNENYLKSLLRQRHHPKITAVYNGLDLRQFKPDQCNGKISKEVKLLSVARLIEEKGHIYLLKACKILRDRGHVFRCEIVGGPVEPMYSAYFLELKRLHWRLKLQENVFFCGAQPFAKVLQKYKNADIFILPCVIARNGGRDITPNVLIEAMAMKLPVISTTITGIPEIIDDGVNGILVPPADVDALVYAMTTLIKNAEQRKVFGIAGRKKVEERFDISKNINKYIELFEEGYTPAN